MEDMHRWREKCAHGKYEDMNDCQVCALEVEVAIMATTLISLNRIDHTDITIGMGSEDKLAIKRCKLLLKYLIQVHTPGT